MVYAYSFIFSWHLLIGMAKPNGMVMRNGKAGKACSVDTAVYSAGIAVSSLPPGSGSYNPCSGYSYSVLLAWWRAAGPLRVWFVLWRVLWRAAGLLRAGSALWKAW